MKKIISILIVFLVLFSGCEKKEIEKSDGQRFKKEYEALNGVTIDGKTYSTIEIDGNNTIRYAESGQLEELFLKGTHVVYLGWPECPWCRRALPVLIDTVNEYSGVNLYVYNIKEARTAFENGEDNEASQLYKSICAALELSDCDFTDIFERYEDGTLRLVSSAIYFIKDGGVIGIHTRTVQSHIDSYEPLTADQENELKDIYRKYLDILTTKSDIGCGECD